MNFKPYGSNSSPMIGDLRRRRPVRGKGQLEVADDLVDDGIVGQESDHAHLSAHK